jgi:hypothetical protein
MIESQTVFVAVVPVTTAFSSFFINYEFV